MTKTLFAAFSMMLVAGGAFAQGGEKPEARFAAPPRVTKAGGGAKISFAVSAATDAEVAILDAQGKIVRHLGAGLLGDNAPAPFQKGLAQEIAWDGRDDAGRAATRGPFKARVAIGTTPKLDNLVGSSDKTLPYDIVGMVVGPNRELFVTMCEFLGTGMSEIRVLDQDGMYLRTIMPYPAGTPKERTESVGHLMVDGQRVPLIFNGRSRSVYPLVAGLYNQTMAWHPRGYLMGMSAMGTMFEHGPPRHLLAFDPAGGAPLGVPFVGPQVRLARGFMGGAGERGADTRDRMAVSPDGTFIYVVHSLGNPKVIKHGVFRCKWSDKDAGEPWLGRAEPGTDDKHFNSPRGLAVDKDGRVYVGDFGNGRVMIFSPDGKLLGQFAVEAPDQIAVSRKTGDIFVLSLKGGRYRRVGMLFRFEPFKGAEPRKLAETEIKGLEVMALDDGAEPTRLWCAINSWYGPAQLLPVTVADETFEIGKPVSDTAGLRTPTHMVADPARNRVLLKQAVPGSAGVIAVDLASGKQSIFIRKGFDMALDGEGNIYVTDGYLTDSMSRYDPAGAPLNFQGTDSNKMKTGRYRDYGPGTGMRGHRVAPNGDIYMLRAVNNYAGAMIDVFGPDGKLKKTLVSGLGGGDCGLGVDAAGNVYVGVNLKDPAKPLPEPFAGKLPADNWVWWRSERDPPWNYPFINPYLFYMGAVFKFGPEGGAVYGEQLPQAEAMRKDAAPIVASPGMELTNAPADAVVFKSANLHRDVKVVGALWHYPGIGVVPGSAENPGPDPGCVCTPTKLDADLWGRVYAPNDFLFCVDMLDSNGNRITRIGGYGNADNTGAAGKTGTDPDIPFACPSACSYAAGKLYVTDTVNHRVVVVKLEHAAEETVPVP